MGRVYFWLVAMLSVHGWSAEIPLPSDFYIVSASFSDNGALFYYRVLEVQPDGADAVIRYTRVAWTNPTACPRRIVQSAKSRLSIQTLNALLKANNPCAVRPTDVAAATKQYQISAAVFETFSMGLVATCGSSK